MGLPVDCGSARCIQVHMLRLGSGVGVDVGSQVPLFQMRVDQQLDGFYTIVEMFAII